MGMTDKKLHRYRMDGMAYALKIVEQGGVEALRQEVKTRAAIFIPLEVTRESVVQINAMLADRILNTMLATSLYTLNQKFGFGHKRLMDYYKELGHNCDMVTALDPFGNNYEKISEYATILKDKYDIDLDINKILEVEQDNQKNHPRMADRDYIVRFLKERGFEDAAECLEQYME